MKIAAIVSSVTRTTTSNAAGTKATEVVKFQLGAVKDAPQVAAQATSSLSLLIKDPALFDSYKQGQEITISVEAA